MTSKGNILERLAKGPVIGDGSYVVTLEKRGYIRAGPYTPECVIESPNAVKQLHRDFLNAGADVIQALTFYCTEGKLQLHKHIQYTSDQLTKAAFDVAEEIRAEYPDTLICGGISPTPTFKTGDLAKIKEEFRKQCKILTDNKSDFLLAEFLSSTAEAEIAVSVMKEFSLPVAVTLRMGPTGDDSNVSCAESAVRLAKAGADIVGLNCQYDPSTCLETIKLMKEGLDAAGLHPYLMLQPLGFLCPDLKEERGRSYPGASKNGPVELYESIMNYAAEKRTVEYWMNLLPASGRPGAPAVQDESSLAQ